MEQIRAVEAKDAAAIRQIYAPYIVGSAVSFELTVPSEGEVRRRISEYTRHAPWLVCEIDGRVAGYAYASKHREREAYRWTAEVSVYVDKAFHKRGVARRLYTQLFRDLESLGFCLILSGITLPNEPSVKFHEAMGFTPIGTYRRIGFKLGQWHDVGWWELWIASSDGPPKAVS